MIEARKEIYFKIDSFDKHSQAVLGSGLETFEQMPIAVPGKFLPIFVFRSVDNFKSVFFQCE